jgi:hypothetical protein
MFSASFLGYFQLADFFPLWLIFFYIFEWLVVLYWISSIEDLIFGWLLCILKDTIEFYLGTSLICLSHILSSCFLILLGRES